MSATAAAEDRLILGRISGVYGVHGWVRVYSYTDPREAIFQHTPWEIHLGGAWRPVALEGGRPHGKGLVAKLAGWDDRDQVRELIGAEIAILRDRLPPLPEGEYYWADLIGLEVWDQEGVRLGRVSELMETGAHDVLVVRGDQGETLIPYVRDTVIKRIDLDSRRIDVEWWSPE